MSRHEACLLCGAADQELVFLAVRWRDPLPGQPFGAIPRCVDRISCRARVEGRGDPWEVIDAGEMGGGSKSLAIDVAAGPPASPVDAASSSGIAAR